ncbi:hypothetical protein [Leptothermofonsia sp. ETS-13]|uniref:hypothetical protein n=1 Tax=Leptothermofonsia sp. ETS-13 TaxID=3035696 RepID=UPI003B9DDF77
MNLWKSLTVASAVTFAALPVTLSVRAQTCTPLKVVGGTGTQIQKTVSPPGAEIVRNNWNTDFAVPSTASFRRYIATILPKNGGEYTVQVSLKYNDNSADKVFDQTLKLPQNRSYRITGSPRLNANPYQVNLFVGGLSAVGNSYTASVVGCN